jgi:hypothetical protein
MDLKMFINEKLVDTEPIKIWKLNLPGYIRSLQMDMEERNEDIIDLSNEEPKFFIDRIPSTMNDGNRFLKVD